MQTFQYSGVKDKSLLSDPLKADCIGALCSTSWKCSDSTHLVTDVKKNSGKNIMAWATSRPIVTVKWVEALHARKHGDDTIPDELKYIPPGSAVTDDTDPSQPRNRTLKKIYLLSLLDEELEELAIAGGAKVCRCHEMSDEDFYEEKGGWLKNLLTSSTSRSSGAAGRGKQTSAKQNNSVVLLEPDRVGKELDPKVSERRDYLLKTFGVPLTDQRQLATAVTSIQNLMDAEGERDLTEKIWNGRKVAKNRQKEAPLPLEGEDGCKGIMDASSPSADDMDETERLAQSREENFGDDDDGDDSDATTDDEQVNTVAAATHNSKASSGSGGGGGGGSSGGWVSRGRRKAKNGENSGAHHEEVNKSGGGTAATKAGEAARNENESDFDDDEKENDAEAKEDDAEEEDEEGSGKLPEAKISLSTLKGDDGWLIAAPADRKDYTRPLGDEVASMKVGTEIVLSSILVVRSGEAGGGASQNDPDEEDGGSAVAGGGKGRKRKATKGKGGRKGGAGSKTCKSGRSKVKCNFKKFKKNKISGGKFSRVSHMCSVEAKETERSNALHLTQMEIESRQREAEELFDDRMQSGGRGGIESYMTGGSSKKARRKRM